MAEVEICDVCGSTDLRQFKCKLICQNCGATLRTCSDLNFGLRTNGTTHQATNYELGD